MAQLPHKSEGISIAGLESDIFPGEEQLSIVEDIEFPFPYQPYDIQLKFMSALYHTLEGGGFGIFESPTGTVCRDAYVARWTVFGDYELVIRLHSHIHPYYISMHIHSFLIFQALPK